MKTFFAILLTVFLPLPCEAGLFFGPNNRTVVHNYGGAAPAHVNYYGGPAVGYSYPATGYSYSYSTAPVYSYSVPATAYYSAWTPEIVTSPSRVRSKTITRHRHGRTHVHTHSHEHY
jgi:hypothetical protein